MRPRISLVFLFLFYPLLAVAEAPLAPIVVGRAPGYQRHAQIAANGGQYFAAWDDDREVVGEQAYGARLAADGTLLDPVDIRLEDLVSARGIGCGGGRCAVVDHQLHFAIVDSQGKVTSHGIVAGDITRHVAVIYNGRDFLVFWGYNDVNVATLGVDGQVGERVVIAPYDDTPRRFQSAAFNGSRFVALYTTGAAVLKAAVTEASGAPLATGIVVAEGAVSDETGPPGASIASSGSELAAVWKYQNELRVRRFGADGMPMGEPVVVRKDTSFMFDIVGAADGWLVEDTEGWPDMKLFAVPVTRELIVGGAHVVLAPQPFAVSTFAGAGTLVVADMSHPNEARGAEIVAAGLTASPLVVSRAGGAQRNPEIAIGRGTTLVVSEEDRGGGPDQPLTSVRATFTDHATGTTSTFAVAPSDVSQSRPIVAVAGDSYLVIWAESGALLLRARVVRNGEPVGPVIELASTSRLAAVASDGRDFFVATYEFPASTLITSRLSADGAFLGRSEAIPVSAPLGTPSIAIACAGEECILAWRNLVVGPCIHLICKTDDRLFAARMETSLAMRDATPFELSAGTYGLGDVVAAAGGDGTYAVAWDYPGFVRARTISALGAIGDTVERAGYRPALVHQSGSWLLLRDAASVAGPRIGVTRFRGGVAATDFELTVADAQARTNAAAAADGDSVVVAYERTTRDEPAGGVPRVYLETIRAPKPKERAVRR
jgi:hypothetical protein